MSTQAFSEQEKIRREKLQKLKDAGIDPYPAALFPVSHYSADIKNSFTEEKKDDFAQVSVAGRIMSINDKGKVFFIKIQDKQGLIQLYVKRDEFCPGEDKSFWDNVVKHGWTWAILLASPVMCSSLKPAKRLSIPKHLPCWQNP